MLSALSPQVPPQAGMVSDPVKDVGLANFVADVIEASQHRPVVLNFWAVGSAACKQLAPVLEKCVRDLKGVVHLAKIDIDQNQQIAQQMGIQSIPAVFAFFRGQPIDGFTGALPEAQIKTWLDRLVKAAGAAGAIPPGAGVNEGLDEALKQAAEFLAAKDSAAAQAIYGDILDMDSSHPAAFAGFLRCLIARGDTARAKEMLSTAPADMVKDKAFGAVRAAIELAEQAAQGGAADELLAKVQKNPDDHQLRFDLAMALYAADQCEDAVGQLLEIVRRARSWNEGAARKQLVKFFEAFGPVDPLTISARKRLSSILFS